jgi:hypothetical protein
VKEGKRKSREKLHNREEKAANEAKAWEIYQISRRVGKQKSSERS